MSLVVDLELEVRCKRPGAQHQPDNRDNQKTRLFSRSRYVALDDW